MNIHADLKTHFRISKPHDDQIVNPNSMYFASRESKAKTKYLTLISTFLESSTELNFFDFDLELIIYVVRIFALPILLSPTTKFDADGNQFQY